MFGFHIVFSSRCEHRERTPKSTGDSVFVADLSSSAEASRCGHLTRRRGRGARSHHPPTLGVPLSGPGREPSPLHGRLPAKGASGLSPVGPTEVAVPVTKVSTTRFKQTPLFHTATSFLFPQSRWRDMGLLPGCRLVLFLSSASGDLSSPFAGSWASAPPRACRPRPQGVLRQSVPVPSLTLNFWNARANQNLIELLWYFAFSQSGMAFLAAQGPHAQPSQFCQDEGPSSLSRGWAGWAPRGGVWRTGVCVCGGCMASSGLPILSQRAGSEEAPSRQTGVRTGPPPERQGAGSPTCRRLTPTLHSPSCGPDVTNHREARLLWPTGRGTHESVRMIRGCARRGVWKLVPQPW